MTQEEILIVGAGPVGLSMAIQLARFKVPFQIIDKAAEGAKDSRAVGVQPRTLEVFEDMGVLAQFLKRGVKVVGLALHSKNERLVHSDYRGLDTPYSYLLDIPQRETEALLVEKLKELGQTVQRGVELNHMEDKGGHVEVMLGKHENDFSPHKFAYIVGCDGARSTCRKLTKTPFPGSEYPSEWIVLDAKVVWEHDPQEVNLFTHPDGVIATFPLPGDRVRVTIERKQGDQTKPSADLVIQRLRERISPKIDLVDPADASPFIIHHRQVTRYRTGRIFLAGDAAHLHSPAGGQGMNTGIQDAYNLSWKLALVMQGKGRKELLDSYHKERHPIAKDVLALTHRLTKIMTAKQPALRFIRDAAMTLAGQIPGLKKQLPKRFSEIDLQYEKSEIVVENAKHPPGKIEVGKRAPDHLLKRGNQEVRLFELFKGTHSTLLFFQGKKPGEGSKVTFKHPEVHTYYLYRNETDAKSCKIPELALLDLEPSAHTHYGIEIPTAVLIRPDGVIGLIQEPPDEKGLIETLNQVYLT